MIHELAIKVSNPQNLISSLSGGNQQKVVVGKALLTEPKVLLMDEPTRGIDVGAKEEIFEIMRDLAAQGSGHHLCFDRTQRNYGDGGSDHCHVQGAHHQRISTRRGDPAGAGRSLGSSGMKTDERM